LTIAHAQLFCPKSRNGSFQCPVDPAFLLDGGERTNGYVEGDAEQWRWFVPHDVTGLASLFGKPGVSMLNAVYLD
jgi:putative alpha-1,2-mannosidase